MRVHVGLVGSEHFTSPTHRGFGGGGKPPTKKSKKDARTHQVVAFPSVRAFLLSFTTNTMVYSSLLGLARADLLSFYLGHPFPRTPNFRTEKGGEGGVGK